ncbi:MAG: hypothetical protein GY870_07445, partial [archaeon]|nr:hypothetical protein [archaeon]
MAVNDFKSNLIQFGKSIYILGIIFIVNLLYSFVFSNIILDLIVIIMNFILIVYAVNKILSLNNIFHSEYVNSYRMNMLISSIIKLISTIFLVVFLFINAETILEMSNEIMNFDVENASDEEIGIFLLP